MASTFVGRLRWPSAAVPKAWLASSFGSGCPPQNVLLQHRNAARLAVPRGDGLGTERLGNEDVPEAPPSTEAMVDETPAEEAAVGVLAAMSSTYHTHSTYDSGLFDKIAFPIDEFGGEDSDEELDFDHPSAEQTRERHFLGLPQQPKTRPQLGVLQRLAALEGGPHAAGTGGTTGQGRQRRGTFEFADDQPIRVRVLDVDALPLEEVHLAFMHTLVRRRPAEVSIHVASRIAQFREKHGQQGYQNLLRDAGRLFGSTHGPELMALLARCYCTISVPFMVDYTRRYGQFSRAFIANQVEQSMRPAFFDFIRYQKRGGVRPLPLLVSKPWALSSYTRLMAKCSLKSYMHEQLKLYGHVPQPKVNAHVAHDLPAEVRVAEQLSAAGALRVAPPQRTSKPGDSNRHRRSPLDFEDDGAHVERPALLEAIMEAEHSGRGWTLDSAVEARAARDFRPAASSAAGQMDETLDSAEVWSSGSDGEEEEEGRWDDNAGLSEEERGRFALQFQPVISDADLDQPDDALVEADGQHGLLDELALPDRYWGRSQLAFFRHMHKAYRIVQGQWAQVPDPRGPRPKPRRHHKPRQQRREDRLRREMLQSREEKHHAAAP